MIRIISSANKNQESFKNYHELCDYINKAEKLKSLESGKTRWRFSRRKHETLSFVYYRIPKAFKEVFTQQEKEAFEKGLGLIEILKGGDLTQILFTPHLDIDTLKKNWCCDYCLEHGYTVCEAV